MLREAGIGAQIKFFPGPQLFAPAGEGGILQLGKFDMAVDGWYAGIDPDDSSQYMCANFPPGRLQLDALLQYKRNGRGAKRCVDTVRPSHAQAAYSKIASISLRDDVPQIFVGYAAPGAARERRFQRL